MAPSEALANNTPPFNALQTALRDGTVAKALSRPVRDSAPGVRSLTQVTPELRDQLVADYRSGLGVYDLAQVYGLHRVTIVKHLRLAGVVMRRTITKAEHARARNLYLSGATYREIARQLGRDPATVKKTIHPLPDEASPHGPAPRTEAAHEPAARIQGVDS